MGAPQADGLGGQLIGRRYRLQSVVGSGGSSTVFRAHDEVLGRAVAVKLFGSGSIEPEREEGEVAVLASLDHHALVTMLDAGIHEHEDGAVARYIVMALVKGQNLQQRLAQGPIAPRNIGEIGYDLAEALHYVHAHNVIHRDIKPANVLLVDYGADDPRARAMLSDFGIARADDIDHFTAEGVTTGTAAYLSPEQATGAEVTHASDVYSLGLVLLECFTRKMEFPGVLMDSVVARLNRDPVVPVDLPDHWRELLSAMMARDPAARPARRDLVALLRQTTVVERSRHKDPVAEPTTGGGAAGFHDILSRRTIDRITAIAARMFDAPIAIVSAQDNDRTWFASHYGPEVEETARRVDLSRAAPPDEYPVVVPDATKDERAKNSPLVTGPLALRFYVGVPIKRTDGHTIGTLSVLDFVPGTASESQIASLKDLAALAVTQLDLRPELLRGS